MVKNEQHIGPHTARVKSQFFFQFGIERRQHVLSVASVVTAKKKRSKGLKYTKL